MELTTKHIIAGGKALARHENGKTVFVRGALDTETVEVEITTSKKGFDEAQVSSVVSPSSQRVTPTCAHVTQGCGGCDWQHIDTSHQSTLRQKIVAESLRRIAKVEHTVDAGPSLPDFAYRTTMRCGITEGKVELNKHASHETLPIPDCKIVHPKMLDLLTNSGFGNNTEVTIRVSDTTGERIVLAETDRGVDLPDDVRLVVTSNRPSGEYITETIAGQEIRCSAESFFQPSREAAEALVEVIQNMIPDDFAGTLLDAYCGVGLFAATVAPNARVIALESSASAIEDAKVNLGEAARIIETKVEDFVCPPVDIAIADPPRKGLDKKGVKAILNGNPSQIILVSCDPASFARDTALLIEQGYALGKVVALDNFAQTSHIETVANFQRATSDV